MKRVRFGFRNPLTLLGLSIFPHASTWVTRLPADKANDLAAWVASGKQKAAEIGNDAVRAFVDRIFIEVE